MMQIKEYLDCSICLLLVFFSCYYYVNFYFIN